MNNYYESFQDSEISTDVKPKQTIQSVERALKVLDILGKEGRPMNPKELAIEAGINLGTCYHLLNTLRNQRYVFKDRLGEYSLGNQIPFLNNTYMQSLNLNRRLYESAFNLRNKTLESVYLGGLVGDHVQITAILEGPQNIKVNHLYVGYHQYPHARAMTKGIIAFWKEEEALKYLSKYSMYERLTRSTPTNEQEVMIQLRLAKELGFILDEGEFIEGIHGIVAPIFSVDGSVQNGVGIALPSQRFHTEFRTLIPEVVNTAREISLKLGFQGNVPFNFDVALQTKEGL
jgi:DNA-binding IclR family transcriptional regulator